MKVDKVSRLQIKLGRLIYRSTTKTQIKILASTYVLYHYISHGCNFRQKDESIRRTQKDKQVK